MPYDYTDPKRASNPHALPDVEIFEDDIVTVHCVCGDCDVPAGAVNDDTCYCPSCGRNASATPTERSGFFFAFGLPGCLWDSEPDGPYDSYADALAAARQNVFDDGGEDDE